MNNWNNTNYLSLSTQKKDGSYVETPVWFAKESDTFFLFSEGKAGKVKRIRNFNQVKVSPCTVTGKVIGNWQDATAELLETNKDKEEAYNALLRRYGWQLRLLDFGSRLAGKINKRAFIKITLNVSTQT